MIFVRQCINQENINVISTKTKFKWYGDEIPFQTTNYLKIYIPLGKILEVPSYRSQDQDNDDFTGYNIKSSKCYFAEICKAVANKKQLTEQQS